MTTNLGGYPLGVIYNAVNASINNGNALEIMAGSSVCQNLEKEGYSAGDNAKLLPLPIFFETYDAMTHDKEIFAIIQKEQERQLKGMADCLRKLCE